MKKFTILLMLFLLFSVGFSSITSAASTVPLGTVLTNPEEGWQRIDDNNENIFYIGKGWSTLARTAYYEGSRHNSSSNELDDKIVIKFKGTKFRIISSAFPDYTDNLIVTIDGVSETYSQTAPTNRNIALTYEKLDLEDTIHLVEISKITKGSFGVDLTLDAIDIDDTGSILDPATPIPSPEPQPDPTDPTPTEPEQPSNPDPQPEQPSGDRAILVVTMTTGLEKEYDLPMSDINAFLNWYDARDVGSGPAKFAINKYSNNKGPFSKRTDYVIFDKILTFEVSEYTTN